MSFYDDSTLMFLADGAVGKDGKASTIKPVGGGAPLYVTRGSNLTATRVDSNGLIEKGRENTQLYTNNLSNLSSNQYGKNEVLVSTAQADPFGNNDAVLLTPTTTNSYHRWYKLNATSVGVQTISLYAKPNGYTNIYAFCNANNQYATYSLVGSGSVITSSQNTIDSRIEQLSGGWYRISHTVNCSSTNWWGIYIGTGTAAYVGDGTSGVYFYGFQVEQGLVATEYIESGATTGKAGLLENEPRFNYPIGGGSPHLLLEPSRTNLSLYSEALLSYDTFKVFSSEVTKSYTTNTTPEGLNSSVTTILEEEATSNHRCYFNDIENCTIGSTYSFSIFAKSVKGRNIRIADGGKGFEVDTIVDLSDGSVLTNANNNVSVEGFGNGWYRISAFGTNNSIYSTQRLFINSVDGTTLSFAGDTTKGFLLWGAQFEEGSYPTSYIPNHSGGSVSRESEEVQTADVSSLNLIGQNEGTFFVDYEFLDGQSAESQNWIALESENGQERVLIYKSSSNSKIQVYFVANNSLVFNANTNVTIVPNTRYKVAFKYSSGDIAVAINGSVIVTSSNTYTRGSDLSRLLFDESNIQPSCRVHQAIVLTSGWDNLDLAVLTGLTDYYASFSEMATALNYTIYE